VDTSIKIYPNKIYPNPSKGLFTIDVDNTSEENQIEVINPLGKLVRQFTTGEI
jgi:hypothetical protein